MEQCPVCEGSGQVESSEETLRILMKTAQLIWFKQREHAYPLGETNTVDTTKYVADVPDSFSEDWSSTTAAIYDDVGDAQTDLNMPLWVIFH